ncbi:methylenetetrahydrofolate--tRNA-(uracil(54)-C(5))-methyltransferase (FADH(2)-oxidizing) TrmFO [Bryobacter aggregatus]|uniref:methylenetetrahydrofolate--tRNA-(uracil(54)- C(5))-methyltransferase (FADH(2)-oxidizing) TrmFO n=1 Tax=Bryobacter aggregatus TaxID=360054 RepID=UPI0004E244AC|nr:methylenetetrahydrofolate--tRNA-(uracil(54)-C(5))-methyltransferase (FADH(2)-oxidizing) TrmFO [Bryobacter aggregatus]
MQKVVVIGAGLAGTEAAWQLARRGVEVTLYEMRPLATTPAHKTADMAELVCSNSLKSESENSAPWLLKQELRRGGSLLLDIAKETRVPAGHALTVDRVEFAREVSKRIEAEPKITVVREEIQRIPSEGTVIIASGPLTSNALAASISELGGSGRLFFYDSISPIVEADSINTDIAFAASRWGKSIDGTDDYLNCPLNQEEYERFVDELLAGESVPFHIEEDNPKTPFFEACLPVEELARRGRETLRFGPMKPTGLDDPRTGRWAYAIVQLRKENCRSDSYNLVGFQNHLRFGEQKRIFRLIPGLENAEFLRYGQIHRNTYVNGPELLNDMLQLKSDPRISFAGQISGVEGYVESIATGFAAAQFVLDPRPMPRESAIGSLCAYISGADPKHYQPANITFDLLPKLDEQTAKRLRKDKKARHAEVCRRALEKFDEYLSVSV